MKKKQHYVPRFYLKEFSNKSKTNQYFIYCYDKLKDDLRPQNIYNSAMEKYFYDETMPTIIEDRLSNIEAEVSTVYHKIINNKGLKELTFEEKKLIAEFIWIQDSRTPYARNEIFKRSKDMLIDLQQKGQFLPNDLFESISDGSADEYLKQEIKKVQIGVIFKSNEEIHNYIANLGWCLLINETNDLLFTSDNPIVKYNPYFSGSVIEASQGFGLGYRSIGIQIFFPLTPTLCLSLFDQKSYYSQNSTKKFSSMNLQIINEMLVAGANQYVFSKTQDFIFAKKFLKKFPQSKDPFNLGLEKVLREKGEMFKYKYLQFLKAANLEKYSLSMYFSYDLEIGFSKWDDEKKKWEIVLGPKSDEYELYYTIGSILLCEKMNTKFFATTSESMFFKDKTGIILTINAFKSLLINTHLVKYDFLYDIILRSALADIRTNKVYLDPSFTPQFIGGYLYYYLFLKTILKKELRSKYYNFFKNVLNKLKKHITKNTILEHKDFGDINIFLDKFKDIKDSYKISELKEYLRNFLGLLNLWSSNEISTIIDNSFDK